MSEREASSFRDPSGFVFRQDGKIYRQINHVYREQYTQLMDSGLYKELIQHRLMVPHEEADIPCLNDAGALVIRPKEIPFISYPYEWCFGQYKQAALTTLRIHLRALNHGMILKDANAYNIQFLNGYAVLVDTLSFEPYQEGMPWIGYGQFCRHFLAPLLLMAKVDVRLSKLMLAHIDGIPLDLADSILRGKLGTFGYGHIRLHARTIARHSEDGKEQANPTGKMASVSKRNITAMAQSMLHFIEKLNPKQTVTEWGDYYSRTNYSEDGTKAKEEFVTAYLDQIDTCKAVWDFGANDGRYSKLAISKGAHVVAFDIDHTAVERNFMQVSKTHQPMLPLLLDLATPSPSIGFANLERGSIDQRQTPDAILMLAVIHHLAISNNLPLDQIARWLSSLGKHLIIEFVPKEDSQVQILLRTRTDIFPDYTEPCFEAAFEQYFTRLEKREIPGSKRSLYLFRSKSFQ
ncbi:MAG: class I SAM-dependent methyltransferase [Oscillospiraceae bacterium]|nr:class I SAM-dependent methyltransferase [Oscillospiraceae bacterium]